MHCAGCVNSIQLYVSTLPGVSKVEVNLASERAVLEFDSSQVELGAIEKAIQQEVGYRVVYQKSSLASRASQTRQTPRGLSRALPRWKASDRSRSTMAACRSACNTILRSFPLQTFAKNSRQRLLQRAERDSAVKRTGHRGAQIEKPVLFWSRIHHSCRVFQLPWSIWPYPVCRR